MRNTMVRMVFCAGFTVEHMSEFKNALNHAVMSDLRSNRENLVQAVLAVDMLKKESEFLADWPNTGITVKWWWFGRVHKVWCFLE